MKIHALNLIALLFIVNATGASAQRVVQPFKNGPGSQPGNSGKVTRVDFEKKHKDEDDRKERIKALELEEEESDDEVTKQAKRKDRDALEALGKKLEEEEKAARKKNPEDFAKDATRVPMTATSKTSSSHETVATKANVVQKAQTVIIRRAR
jgi:hypothetical protein